MTGLEALIAKELVEFAAKAIWNMVNPDENDLKAEQAKAHSKAVLRGLPEDAQQALKEHRAPKV